MSKIIGMSRNIKIEWLNKAADLYISGKTERDTKDELNEYLSFEIKSPTNLRKTREILMNIWTKDICPGNSNAVYTKDLTAKLFLNGRSEEKLLAHWCLMLAAYPVFAEICGIIGKMDDKMFDISNKEISSKMFDLWGERSTLLHSISKNLKTLKDIDVLCTLPKNKYGIKKHIIEGKDGLRLIAYTVLYLKEKLYMSTEELNNSPEMFPFEYCITIDALNSNGLFSIDKFGGELVISKR